MFADALAVKAGEQRRRAGPVKTLVMIENPYPHKSFPGYGGLSEPAQSEVEGPASNVLLCLPSGLQPAFSRKVKSK